MRVHCGAKRVPSVTGTFVVVVDREKWSVQAGQCQGGRRGGAAPGSTTRGGERVRAVARRGDVPNHDGVYIDAMTAQLSRVEV